MANKLPIYNAVIGSEEDGIYCLSLVDCPATEVNWMCFEKQKEQLQFKIEDEEKHIISTVVMVANTPIYRRNGDYEFYIQYTPETIAVMAEKMLADNAMNTYDIQHNDEILPKGCVSMVELYIVDEAKGIKPTFMDVPDGSLMCSLKVHNDELWEMAKNGTLNGISLAGLFTIEEQKFNKQKSNYKNMFSKIKQAITNLLVTFSKVTAEDGTELIYDGDAIEVGIEVVDGEGNPIADGEYVIDGVKYTVKDGKIEEIEEPKDEPTEEPTEETPVEDEEKKCKTETEEETPSEEPQEPTEEPKEEEEPEVDYQAQIDTLKEEIESLKAQIAEVLAKPAVEPIAEEFEKQTELKYEGLTKGQIKAIEMAKALHS